MEQNTAGQYDDDLTVGIEESEDFLDTGFVDLFENVSNNGSPISRLKTIVLSIDWEINDEVLTQFNEELLVLKETWGGDQVKLVYVQALEKISKYIYQQKSEAHPNAIKLLLTLYYNLEKIVLGTDLTESEVKEILRDDIQKFEQLKQQIGAVGSDKTSSSDQALEGETDLPASEQKEPHPVLFNLKACILGMDWEITERELVDLGEEIATLEDTFAGQKPHLIFLQGISALGGYIELKKSDAHADAFKLLYSFYEGLEEIVVNPDLSGEQVKSILLPEVEKFEVFKRTIAATITPDAIAEKVEDERQNDIEKDDAEGISPAFADVPDEVTGFQAEEEAETLGKVSDDVDNRLENFFPEDDTEEETGEGGDESLSAEALEKIDSFFGDDIVDDALSVASISSEDALRGVDVETEADDDSDEEALPIQDDGMLAPALADSGEDEPFGFDPDRTDEEVGESGDSEVAARESEESLSRAAALQGVAVETDADDDSDEQPLPMENEDIAPALVMEETDVETTDESQTDPELTDIDAHIDGFFEDGVAAENMDESDEIEVADSLVQTLPDDSDVDATDFDEESLEDRLETFFPDSEDAAQVTAALDESISEQDDADFEEGEFFSDDGAIPEIPDTDSELESVSPDADKRSHQQAESITDEEEPEIDTAAISEPVEDVLDDDSFVETEITEEIEAAEDAEDDLFSPDSSIEQPTEEADTEAIAAEVEAEIEHVDETVNLDDIDTEAKSDTEIGEEGAFDVEEQAVSPEEPELSAFEEDKQDDQGIESVVDTLDDRSEEVQESVSSFGTDSEEEQFFAAIDDRVEEPSEIQMELLAETDELTSTVVSDTEERDDGGSTDQIVPDDAEGMIERAVGEDEIEEIETPLPPYIVDDELSELRAGVASLGVEINETITGGLLTEINRLRHRMMTKPVEKTFLQLLSTIVQHISQRGYEASSDAHTLVLSVFDKLERAYKDENSQDQSQELLLEETCKVLLWQQKMIDRQSPNGTEGQAVVDSSTDLMAEMHNDTSVEELPVSDELEQEPSSEHEQEFDAIFEPVDDEQEVAAFEAIEATQEDLEQELADTFIDEDVFQDDSQQSVSGQDEKPVAGSETVKLDKKSLSSLLTTIVKREVKALKDLIQNEFKVLKGKIKDKD